MCSTIKPGLSLLLAVMTVGCGEDPTTLLPTPTVDSTIGASPPEAATRVAGQFPRHVQTDTASLIYHAPQIRSWVDFKEATAWSVVEIHLNEEPKPYFVSAKVTFDTDPDLDRKLVEVSSVTIDDLVFSGIPIGKDTAELETLVKANARTANQTVPLDLFLVYLSDDAIPASDPRIRSEPPTIYVAYNPTIVVMLDGDPVLADIEESGLAFAVNTNWPLFQAADTQRWYLLNEDQWLTTDSLEGGWRNATSLPVGFTQLPDDGNWNDIKASADRVGNETPLPRVIVSTGPAELIDIDGEPVLEPIGDTGLQYVTNTETNLFHDEDTWYFLVSGRWFQTLSLDESWAAVDELPEAFEAIPEDHEMAHVRSSVPGTMEALLAAMEAEIPKKNEVARDAQPSVEVTYAGMPEFESIEGTDLKRATNTGYDVIQVGDLYYLCYGGIWYASPSPEGPWNVAPSVPTQIYNIPPSSPAYHTTYVYVRDTTPTTVTYVYTSGYTGTYVYGGTVVWGTGWYYPPYVYYGYGYPVYYRPTWRTWGSAAWYNPNTGAYRRGVRAYGPYGGYGYTSTYNPNTGRYGRAEAVWDGDEAYMRGESYNPRTGVYGQTERSFDDDGNEYAVNSEFRRGDDTVTVDRNWDKDSGTARIEHSNGQSAEFHREKSGDGWKTNSVIETKDGRTITGSGEFSGGEGTANLKGSEGGSGTVTRSYEDGRAVREGEFTTAEGKELSTKSTGGPGGPTLVQGEQGQGVVKGRGENKTFVGQSNEGDLYAARDGNVYKRDEDGWSKHGNDGNWNPVESGSGQSRTNSETRSQQRNNFDMESAQRQAQERSASTSYQQRSRTGSQQWSSNRNGNTYSQLNRDYSARQQGMNRYQGRSSYTRGGRSMSRGGRSMSRGGGRRR